MSRLKLPLYSKILLWFLVNLLMLALLGFGFLKAQFRLGLDWMLSGEPGDRLAAIGDSVTYEFSRLPESEWASMLHAYEARYGVTAALFNNRGEHEVGVVVAPPLEVMRKLVDRRPPGDGPQRRPPGPVMKRPADAPPKPRFMMRAGDPARYWAGIHLDLLQAKEPVPLILVMVSESISGGGLYFDLWPWLALLVAALAVSAIMWFPFVRGITGFISTLNHAAGRIAHGKFEERIERGRSDELGELATSVNAMAAKLGDYVAQQRRITADVAHELCSPIARMQMSLGVLEQRGTPEQMTYLHKLDRELQHMARLVEEVLAFSKAERLPESEPATDFDLRDLVDQVVAREAGEVAITMEVNSLSIHSLRSALDRALGNVLRNAVRYASDISIVADLRDEEVFIEVNDRGPGVPEEALPRLFEPFFRPEAARGRTTGGSGLGLAITMRCVQACGGSVCAMNRQGGGLTVVIRLPVRWQAP